MESIRKIYKTGLGPSSSHTMGPRFAAGIFKAKNEPATQIRITLYGSLAATGKGHLTDKVLRESFPEDKVKIIWEKDTVLPQHPNGMKFEALDDNGNLLDEWTVFSVGGGDIEDDEMKSQKVQVYPHTKMTDILKWCQKNGRTLWEYVEIHEGEGIWEFLAEVWVTMKQSITRGLEHEGVLPGILHLPRKASSYYIKAKSSAGTL